MSTKIGTAANYAELLTLLDAFLTTTGHAWGLTYSGAGNGRLRGLGGAVGGYIGTAASVTETINIVAIDAASFTVTGTVSGALGTATVGADFNSSVVAFRIAAGSIPFASGDAFSLNTGPKWKRLRFGGCPEALYYTGSMSTVAQLFDGSTTTQIPVTTMPATVRVEMLQPTAVRGVAIWCGSSTNQAPRDFALEWSDNGTTWSVAQSWSAQTWSAANQRRDFVTTASAGAHKYWRLNVTAGQTASLTMTEVRLYADTGMKWDVSTRFEFAWEAPGYDGLQKIYVAGYTNTSGTNDYFNWVFRGFRYWVDPEQSVLDVPDNSGDKALLLSKTPIAYWFVVNGGRVMIVARVSSFYQIAYVGFGLPYETPDDHKFPYITGAPHPGVNARWDTTNAARYRNPCDPGAVGSGAGSNAGLAAIFPTGQWFQIANRYDSSATSEGSGASSADGLCWPYGLDLARNQPSWWGDNIDGTKSTINVVIQKVTDPAHPWGEFDGVAWITGQRNTAEALELIGAIDYMCVPNINRSGFGHFCAVALD